MGSTQQRVPWAELRRTTKHRTSEPTDLALRSLVARLSADRPAGRRPFADAVVLAAVQIIAADDKLSAQLVRRVSEIEAGKFEQEPRPGGVDPGS